MSLHVPFLGESLAADVTWKGPLLCMTTNMRHLLSNVSQTLIRCDLMCCGNYFRNQRIRNLVAWSSSGRCRKLSWYDYLPDFLLGRSVCSNVDIPRMISKGSNNKVQQLTNGFSPECLRYGCPDGSSERRISHSLCIRIGAFLTSVASLALRPFYSVTSQQ